MLASIHLFGRFAIKRSVCRSWFIQQPTIHLHRSLNSIYSHAESASDEPGQSNITRLSAPRLNSVQTGSRQPRLARAHLCHLWTRPGRPLLATRDRCGNGAPERDSERQRRKKAHAAQHTTEPGTTICHACWRRQGLLDRGLCSTISSWPSCPSAAVCSFWEQRSDRPALRRAPCPNLVRQY